MSVATLEAIVENGQIKLLDSVRLIENSRVYVIVPDPEAQPVFKIGSPRLANPAQAINFQKEVFEETDDANL